MQKFTHNEKALLTLIAVVVVLGGGYVLFQGNWGSNLPINTATTTPAATTTAAAPVKTGYAVPATPAVPPATAGTGAGTASVAPSASDVAHFNVKIDTKNAVVGGAIPQILISLPANSGGKIIVITLEPDPASKTVSNGILLAAPANTNNNTYSISGLRYTDATDPATGKKFEITPGTYRIETTLWDHTPFTALGTYGNFAGNNAISIRSAKFTITAAP